MAFMELPHTMTVSRLGSSGANKEVYAAREGSVACFLQPAMNTEAEGYEGGPFTKGSRCYVEYDADVRVKDRVVIDDQTYNVSGEVAHQYGTWPHRVLNLEAL